MNRFFLPLRPHHALCLRFFIGRGYGDDFVAGMAGIQRYLRKNPDQRVILTSGTDRICARCPNNRSGVCATSEKSARYDRKCLAACGLGVGQVLPWRELEQITNPIVISRPARAAVCSDCRWDSLCREQQEKFLL
ncbi:DUF1284 domain-containing protein [Caproiciproducens sp. NJN-50]|uniref:DUF1284 domain-containing protein n=1 Tax=Acutalibacteraceae TaxID=3082771 RepID=UPI000FFDFE15|nr:MULTISPECIES: DUF1284 domain-containing protein [Acutalibacteraceae]QAT51156.1 DUF1284 domain-containing protein [Caproiciproducens sp. NJN-50]